MAEAEQLEMANVGLDIDADIMAGLDALAADDSEDVEAAETVTEPAEEVDPDAEEVEPSPDETQEEVAEVEAAPEPEADPQLAKRLETIQAAEQRSRENAETYRRETEEKLAARDAELAPQLEELATFTRMKAQVKYDLPGVLAALGVPPEDFEAHSRIMYSMRPEAMSDPRTREAAQRAMQQRKTGDEVASVTAELQELKKQIADRDRQVETQAAQAKVESQIAEYIGKVAAVVTTNTPIASAMLAKTPEKARAELRKHADALFNEYGEIPAHADVVKRFEEVERQTLIERGIDPDVAIKATTAKTKTPEAGETRAAKTLTSNLGTPTRPRPEPQTEEEIDAELLKELAALG